MNTKLLSTIVVVAVTCLLVTPCARCQTVDTVLPVVVKTSPQAGAKDVEPGEIEVKVTFSKEMMDGSWSWSSAWKDSEPQYVGKPRYLNDHKTCVVKVKVESGKTYGWWINSQKFVNFKDKQGRSAVPYLFVFQVK